MSRDFQDLDLDFEKSTLKKLYESGIYGDILPERWERVRRDILFEDVVTDLTGKVGSPIRCPFHGTDSTPSFFLYRGSNDAFCFGCGDSGYYDHIRFVSRYFDISRTSALKWLEKKWNLPPIAYDSQEETDESESVVSLTYEDLQEPFILKAMQKSLEHRDVELALDHIQYFFLAAAKDKLSANFAKVENFADSEREQKKAATILAKVVGQKDVDRILRRKLGT